MAPSDGIVTEMALTVGADTPAVAGLLAANEQEYAVTASLTAEQASLLKAGGTISVMQEQNTGTATLEQVNDDLAQFTVSGTQWKTGAADITVTTMGGTTGLCLPATAVNSDNAGNFVYLVETKNTVLGVQSVLVRLGGYRRRTWRWCSTYFGRFERAGTDCQCKQQTTFRRNRGENR